MATDPTTDSMAAAAAAFSHLREVDDPEHAGHSHAPPNFMAALEPAFDMITKMKENDAAEKKPMQPVLDHLLRQAAAAAGPGAIAAFEGQIYFKDATALKGAVRAGEFIDTYVIGFGMADKNGRPVEGQMVEVYFHATDVTRVVTLRAVETPKIVLVGGGNDRIFTPNL